tara:strand:+ start:9005 stop:9202 length:198 start_codon:yes stop_codon:yes gene_type:complete
MDSVNLANFIHEKIKQLEGDRVEYVSSGNIKDMEDYRFVMGELSALRTLRDELRKALQNEGDFDE